MHRLDAPLTELPPAVRTVVIAAPAGREIDRDEVEALERFVTAGGTLVYLAPPVLQRAEHVDQGRHPHPPAPVRTHPHPPALISTRPSV